MKQNVDYVVIFILMGQNINKLIRVHVLVKYQIMLNIIINNGIYINARKIIISIIISASGIHALRDVKHVMKFQMI